MPERSVYNEWPAKRLSGTCAASKLKLFGSGIVDFDCIINFEAIPMVYVRVYLPNSIRNSNKLTNWGPLINRVVYLSPRIADILLPIDLNSKAENWELTIKQLT